MKPYTYFIRHKVTGLKYYGVKYGLDADPATFWTEGGYQSSSKLIKEIIEKDGLDSFVAQVRKIFNSVEEAVSYEQRFLRRVGAVEKKDWLNQAYGTGPWLHRGPKTDECKRKLREAHLGKKRPNSQSKTLKWKLLMSEKMRGRVFTEEHKKKISESWKRRKPVYPSEETKKKMSEAHLGHLVSQETKQKISIKNKGRKKPPVSDATREKLRIAAIEFWEKRHKEKLYHDSL